jgi:Asp/Glu/hydantoin racemase
MNASLVEKARCEALFASDVPTVHHLSAAEVAAAVRSALARFGGTRGCAAHMAGCFGDDPELAAARMRWAIETVREARATARVPAGT